MQILADRLRQNYPDCCLGELSEEMNLKRPLFYQSGTEFKKNKVYIAREADVTAQLLQSHGDNLILVVGEGYRPGVRPLPGVCFFPEETSAETLFNTVQRIFDTYDAWDERMQSMALSERTLKKLLDASYRIFHNPIMVSTSGGFIIDYSTMMDTMPEFQQILQHNQVAAAQAKNTPSGEESVQRYVDPATQKKHLFAEIYDRNHNAYRVILVESSRKFRYYDEYLLVHLAKYIQQMLEKYTVLQSDLSYTLDRLLSNILTGESMEAASLAARFESFHWEESHWYFCMTIHVSTVDRQNLTVVRFICNRLEGLMKGSCAFLLDENIVVCVNLQHYGKTMEEAVGAAKEFLKDSYLKAGISYAFTGLGKLKQYYLQSRIALEEGMKRFPLRWVMRFEDIALDYLLGRCTEKLEPEAVCSRPVLELREYDRAHKTEYYETLRTYITCQMNAVKAAKELFIHRSTFLYRMNHIRDLVHMDLEDPDQLLYLLLTYRLLEQGPYSDSDSHSS
ncbi:MAG: helix-turn-helix domain-containing protein [Eubacteriales bacterium]|nr:helix-turn-helix domain-containing protein [Eubacteriales bacterium]